MCGIVGYIGDEQAAPILLNGLSKLEYRGYDSAGIAVYNGTEIKMDNGHRTPAASKGSYKRRKHAPRNRRYRPYPLGNHGSPSDTNAHPLSIKIARSLLSITASLRITAN